MLLVGAYVDARALVSHVLTVPDADPYGRLLLVRELLARHEVFPPGVIEAIDTALADASYRRVPPALPETLAHLSADDVALFERIRDDAGEGKRLAARILGDHATEVDAFSAVDDLAHVKAPVVLLHATDDPVIPSAESMRAAALLTSHGVACRMRTTTLLDHGDVASPWARLREVPGVVDLLAYWLAALGRTNATSATRHQVASSTTNGQ